MKFYYQFQINNLKRILDFLHNENIDEKIQNDLIIYWFILCYHLRDWLQISEFKKEEIDKFIDSSQALSICKVIANTNKHIKLHRYHKSKIFSLRELVFTPSISREYCIWKKNT